MQWIKTWNFIIECVSERCGDLLTPVQLNARRTVCERRWRRWNRVSRTSQASYMHNIFTHSQLHASLWLWRYYGHHYPFRQWMVTWIVIIIVELALRDNQLWEFMKFTVYSDIFISSNCLQTNLYVWNGQKGTKLRDRGQNMWMCCRVECLICIFGAVQNKLRASLVDRRRRITGKIISIVFLAFCRLHMRTFEYTKAMGMNADQQW